MREQETKITEQLMLIDKEILSQFPMQMYLKDVRSHTGYIRRSLFSKKRKRIFAHIAQTYSEHTLTLYLKLGICCFVLDALERIVTKRWPDEIITACYDWFKRIIEDLSTCSDDCYSQTPPAKRAA